MLLMSYHILEKFFDMLLVSLKWIRSLWMALWVLDGILKFKNTTTNEMVSEILFVFVCVWYILRICVSVCMDVHFSTIFFKQILLIENFFTVPIVKGSQVHHCVDLPWKGVRFFVPLFSVNKGIIQIEVEYDSLPGRNSFKFLIFFLVRLINMMSVQLKMNYN